MTENTKHLWNKDDKAISLFNGKEGIVEGVMKRGEKMDHLVIVWQDGTRGFYNSDQIKKPT